MPELQFHIALNESRGWSGHANSYSDTLQSWLNSPCRFKLPQFKAPFKARGTILVNGWIYSLDGLNTSQSIKSYGNKVTVELSDRIEKLGVTKSINHLNADATVVIFDAEESLLYLAGDRFGSSTVYFDLSERGIFFADNFTKLTQRPYFSPIGNIRYLARFGGSHYRMMMNDRTETPFKNIQCVPPASVAKICLKTKTVQYEPYWHLDPEQENTATEATIDEEIREALKHSVQGRLRTTEQAAFSLSGGMDSTSVLSTAAAVAQQALPAFTATYDDPEFDERDDIECMKGIVADPWHAIETHQDFPILTALQNYYKSQSLLLPTSTWLSHSLLCEQVKSLGFTSVFDGLGGDELNAGEFEYFTYFFADLYQQKNMSQLNSEIEKWAEYHNHPIFQKNHSVAMEEISSLTDQNHPGVVKANRARLNRYAHTISEGFITQFDQEPVLEAPFKSYLLNRTYQDLSRETLPLCLRAQKENAASFGLRPISPFLDHKLVELMFTIPGHEKIHAGFTKIHLRRAMTGVLIDEVRLRKNKRGWNAPAHTWFSGKSLNLLEEKVRDPFFDRLAFYDRNPVLEVLADHKRIVESGVAEENHMMFLWQLANLIEWSDAYDVKLA